MIKKSDIIVGVMFPALTSLGLFMAADYVGSEPQESVTLEIENDNKLDINLGEIGLYVFSGLFAIQAINHSTIIYSKHRGTWGKSITDNPESKT